MTEQESEIKIAQLEAEITNIKATFKQFVDTIKTAVKNDSQETEQRITTRMTSFLGDRLDDALKLARKNEEGIASLQQIISGDGDQDPGLKTEMKSIEKDVSDLKLESRDRNTRNNFVRSAWAVAGTIVLGLGIGFFRSILDEKAQNALRVQMGNEQEFAAIKAKADKNNQTFFDNISSLNVHRGKVEADLEWIKPLVKK